MAVPTYTIPKYEDITPPSESGYGILNIDQFKFATNSGNVGVIISSLIPFIYAIAGIILFVFLIIGGFGLLTSGGNPDAVKSAQGKIVSALIGFLIIFASFWIIRIVEVVFGIKVF